MEPQSQPQVQSQPEPQITPIAPVAAPQPQSKTKLISCGELLSRTLTLYKQSYKTFLKTGLVPFILVVVIIALVYFVMYSLGFQKVNDLSYGPLILIWIVELILAIVMLLVKAVVVLQVKQNDISTFLNIKNLFKQGFRLVLPLVWVSILGYLILATGTLLLIIPGIALYVFFLFSGYAVILDGKKGFKALNASWHYVKGYWWAVFGRFLFAILIGIVLEIVVVIIAVTFGFVSALASTLVGPLVIGILVGILILLGIFFMYAVFVPIMVIYFGTLYEDLKKIKSAPQEDELNKRKTFYVTFMLIGIAFVVFYFYQVVPLMLKITTELNKLQPQQNGILFSKPVVQFSTSNPALLESAQYSNKDFGFSINPPKGWKVDAMAKGVVIHDSESKDSAKIAIAVETLPEDARKMSEGEIMKEIGGGVLARFPQLKDVSTNKLQSQGGTFYLIDATIDGDASNPSAHIQFYYEVSLLNLYSIAVIVPDAQWDNTSKFINSSLSTFNIFPPLNKVN